MKCILFPIVLATLTLSPALSVQAFKPPQTPLENLKSDRLLDYEPLQMLLRSGKWREAAAVTSTLMLQAGGKLEQGYLTEANIRYFPCNDLLTVDKLWRYYSGDRFGLSVQSNVWKSIGGKDYKDIPRFERRLGWGAPIEEFKTPEQVAIGYFPLRPGSGGGIAEAGDGKWIPTMPRRLMICQNPPKVTKPTVKKPNVKKPNVKKPNVTKSKK